MTNNRRGPQDNFVQQHATDSERSGHSFRTLEDISNISKTVYSNSYTFVLYSSRALFWAHVFLRNSYLRRRLSELNHPAEREQERNKHKKKEVSLSFSRSFSTNEEHGVHIDLCSRHAR